MGSLVARVQGPNGRSEIGEATARAAARRIIDRRGFDFMEGLRGDALMVTQKWGTRQFAVAA
jgi:hypothetical protein